MRFQWAASASKHQISRARSRHVIAHCGLIYVQAAAPPKRSLQQLVYLGDDATGTPLEVMAVELDDGQTLFVIHSMPLRTKYQPQYQEALKWRH
jgi:hypothetical protein